MMSLPENIKIESTGYFIKTGEVFFADVLQNTDEWMKLRAGRITGSRFKKLFMGKTTKGYTELITEIAIERLTGKCLDDDDSYDSFWMIRGHELEHEGREEYELRTFQLVKSDGFYFNDWIGVSPDGVVEPDGMIEIKCGKHTTHLSWLSKGQLPNEHFHQVHGGMYVIGKKWCDFVSYHPEYTPFICRNVRNPAIDKEFEKEIDIAVEAIKVEMNRLIKVL